MTRVTIPKKFEKFISYGRSGWVVFASPESIGKPISRDEVIRLLKTGRYGTFDDEGKYLPPGSKARRYGLKIEKAWE
ncbi:MAG: hypothetical protein ACE5KE_00680 [Methanosarcinales archaeon]